ncbi:hypothetical protein [Limnohabitans sp. DM1]|uniref:hypothetical protein n=1 Tax=Limnohabitans sp. DM1 TaxID=1597955 RepID=UPI000ABC03A0|nr:hypothetical protein [Limnohabitans sp. DM1]
MKKIYIFLLLIGVGFGCSAQLTKIQVDKLVQAQVADSCNISARVPREQNLPNGAVSQLNRKGFFVGDPLPKEWGSGFNELSIAFSCNPAEELDRPQTWGILDAKSQRWIKNPESMRKELKASTNA